jgi:enolase
MRSKQQERQHTHDTDWSRAIDKIKQRRGGDLTTFVGSPAILPCVPMTSSINGTTHRAANTHIIVHKILAHGYTELNNTINNTRRNGT